jgi:cytochrome c peroxidase
VSRHAVSGESNEMFSDFKTHVIAAPQNRACFRKDRQRALRRTMAHGLRSRAHDRRQGGSLHVPDRAAAEPRHSPAFFHDGAVTTIEAAIRHHLNVRTS